MERYDFIVIGGGPGGYEAAELAGRRGLKTALIERDKLGGICLNHGCIPLKGYLHLAHVQEYIMELQKDRVISGCDTYQVNQPYVVKRNQQVIEKLQRGIEYRLKNAEVTIYSGNAYISSVYEEVIVVVKEQLLIAKSLIIATGSQPVKLPTVHRKIKYQVFYSDEIFQLTNIPHKMVIVGAGAIGLEVACYFNAAGCEVDVIDAAGEIGSGIAADIASVYRKMLERKGIKIYTSSRVKEFCDEEIVIERDGVSIGLRAEGVLIAAGRIPVVQGFGLEESGVAYDKEGIFIDSTCRTNKKNVFACGDVTGKYMLAHTAYEQARVAIDNLTGVEAYINYDIVPQIIYTSPEVMMVGLSESECIARNIQYITKEIPLTYSGKYFIEHKNDGAKAKIMVDAQYKTIIGFTMIGDGASEIALSVEMMIANKMHIKDIAGLIFPHPTVGEIVRELARLTLAE